MGGVCRARAERAAINMLWCRSSIEAGLCEEWPDASAAMSDHVLVPVPVQGYEVVTEARKPRWSGPRMETRGRGKFDGDHVETPAVEMWRSWRKVLEEAVACIWKEVPRLTKHHEGEWSEEATGVVGCDAESVKDITKAIKGPMHGQE